MHWHKANWLGLTWDSCETVQNGMRMMPNKGEWYSAWEDDDDDGDDQGNDNLRVDVHDAVEQSIEVIQLQGPYNWK